MHIIQIAMTWLVFNTIPSIKGYGYSKKGKNKFFYTSFLHILLLTSYEKRYIYKLEKQVVHY